MTWDIDKDQEKENLNFHEMNDGRFFYYIWEHEKERCVWVGRILS